MTSDTRQGLINALQPEDDAERELVESLPDSPLLLAMVLRLQRREFADGTRVGRREVTEETAAAARDKARPGSWIG